jgi:Protein chain release factor A
VPRDPNDSRDIILEVKAGEGGEESALFAGDLLRMYQRYAERRGWKTEILDSTVTGLGGVKDATVAVKGKGSDGAWSRLKYEGGVHRVQRVPVTESQGRSTPRRPACSSRPRPNRSRCRSTTTT